MTATYGSCQLPEIEREGSPTPILVFTSWYCRFYDGYRLASSPLSSFSCLGGLVLFGARCSALVCPTFGTCVGGFAFVPVEFGVELVAGFGFG